MKVTILKKAALQGIPSASGVEVIDGMIYIMGDDSPFLFCLDHNLKLKAQVELFKAEGFEGERIPKKIKPDLECMTGLEINNNKHILLMGSGSKLNRDKVYLVKLPTRYNKNHFVQEFSLTPLYNLFRSNSEITGDGTLNLEAAAADAEHLFLFNRANKAGNNVILTIKLEEFLPYLLEGSDMIPFPSIYNFTLPPIKNIPAGFSGADIVDNKIFFTASAEDTSDAYLDGDVAGSAVGLIEFESGDYLRGNYGFSFSDVKQFETLKEDGKIFPWKVESISVYEKDSDSKYIALAVTDDDKGGSEIMMMEIELF
ncbi:MAG: DUF6929 family protein [Cytophagaceae bacterium]